MEYTPAIFRGNHLKETTLANIAHGTHPILVRRIRLIGARTHNGFLLLDAQSLEKPLSIATDAVMRFGTESITALHYFQRVIERYDLIDVIILSAVANIIPIQTFWIHIEYVDNRRDTGMFSQKDDGLFALRTKSGEKAERVVTYLLSNTYGHHFDSRLYESPGFFQIRYTGKKHRTPDRRCLQCHITFEVKKRNKDHHFRVSHSQQRPFTSENNLTGWHAFVFPDMTVHFVPNALIAQAIMSNQGRPGHDRYDQWMDVDHLTSLQPPLCAKSSHYDAYP